MLIGADIHALDGILRRDLVPVDEAAAALGIEPKRLRGFIARNSIADPIGDMSSVYGWSLRSLAGRIADAGLEVQSC